MGFPSSSDEALFRGWVDAALPIAAGALNDLPGLYTALGVVQKNPYSQSTAEVSEGIQARLLQSLPPGTGFGSEEAGQLRSHLILRAIADGVTLSPYLAVAQVLTDVLRQRGHFAALTDQPVTWATCIQLVRHLVDLGQPTSDAELLRGFRRQVCVATAARELRGIGAKLPIVDGAVALDEADSRFAAEAVLAHIRAIGGQEAVRMILQSIQRAYHPEQMRFHLVRHTTWNPAEAKPGIPWGYLLNLAVREFATVPTEARPAQVTSRFGAALGLATDLVACFDLQPYSIWDHMFIVPSNFLEHLKRIALYDSVFAPTQWRARDVGRILTGVFGWVDQDRVRAKLGWSIDTAIKVAEAILARADPIVGSCFTGEALADQLPDLDRTEVKAVVRVLTHGVGDANKDFLLPTDAATVTVGSRPLLPDGSGALHLVSPPLCGPAFYEGLAAQLREVFGWRFVQENVGLWSERFVHNELARHGVTTRKGDYLDAKGEKGEVDAAVETAKQIIFLELKGKALTRAARGGDAVGLLVDLAATLLKAESQAAGHELRLMRDGSLTLVSKADDGHLTSYRLELANRGVERLAVTLLEYGGFQDRVLCHQVLATSVNASFAATDAKQNEKFRDMRAHQGAIRSQLLELRVLGARPENNPFFASWFLSIPQLLVLLDQVDSPESFWTELRGPRHVTSSTMDLYFEVANSRRIRATPTAP